MLYLAGIAGAFVHPFIALGCYVATACIWVVPDLRIERALSSEE
jgi:hypothetical protein